MRIIIVIIGRLNVDCSSGGETSSYISVINYIVCQRRVQTFEYFFSRPDLFAFPYARSPKSVDCIRVTAAIVYGFRYWLGIYCPPKTQNDRTPRGGLNLHLVDKRCFSTASEREIPAAGLPRHSTSRRRQVNVDGDDDDDDNNKGRLWKRRWSG